MLIFIQEFALQLVLWLLQLVDGIMEIFNVIAGVTNVGYNGNQGTLLEHVMGNSTVNTIFWCIFILGVGLTCIFTIAALIKNMINNQRTVATIVGKFFLVLLGTMAMLAVVVLGVLISNAVLQLMARVFQIGNTTKLSNSLFNACVGDWLDGYSISEVNVSDLSVRDIFGDYKSAFFGIWPKSWKKNGMVNPNTFLYMPALISSIAVSIALIVAIINLAKRIYEIVFLFLVMPMSMSTLPLDDGARVKVWRETLISKIVLAYGAVFSVNIFALLLPIITKIHISGLGSFGNSVFIIFMIIGGSMVIPAGMNLFARLFGTADDMHAGGSFLHSAFYGGRIVSAMTIGLATKVIGGAVKGIKGIASHSKSKKEEGDSDKYSDDKGSGGEETGESSSGGGEASSEAGGSA